MEENQPKHLYKYRVANDLSLDALKRGLVWYSKPEGLNDPHDVSARWQKDFTDKEIVEDYLMMREVGTPVSGIADEVKKLLSKGWSYKKILKYFDDLFMPVDRKPQRELLQDVLYYNEVMFSAMGVLSLSEDPLHQLMWAHYSDSHKGFCLGFENHETNIIGQYGSEVNYFKKMPKPNIRGFQKGGGGEVINMIAYSKSLDWKYEKEWRILKQTGNNLYSYPGKLSEVILGLKISSEDEDKVRNAVTESGYAPLYKRVVKNDGQYDISFVEC